jgi:acyl-CoA thioester hydrolase
MSGTSIGEIQVRVRYAEVDRMGFLHHANYLVYLEQARIDMLRAAGFSYRELEDQGFFLVLTKVEIRYRRPAGFDDLLTIRVRVERVTGARIDHAYEVRRGEELLSEATTTLACVDREGRPRSLPDFLRGRGGASGSAGS